MGWHQVKKGEVYRRTDGVEIYFRPWRTKYNLAGWYSTAALERDAIAFATPEALMSTLDKTYPEKPTHA